MATIRWVWAFPKESIQDLPLFGTGVAETAYRYAIERLWCCTDRVQGSVDNRMCFARLGSIVQSICTLSVIAGYAASRCGQNFSGCVWRFTGWQSRFEPFLYCIWRGLFIIFEKCPQFLMPIEGGIFPEADSPWKARFLKLVVWCLSVMGRVHEWMASLFMLPWFSAFFWQFKPSLQIL